jgi:hypothetical protein
MAFTFCLLTGLVFNTLGTGYLNCLYAYKRKSASPVLNVLNFSIWFMKYVLLKSEGYNYDINSILWKIKQVLCSMP